MAFVGTRAMFEKAGFAVVGSTDAVASKLPRLVMRRMTELRHPRRWAHRKPVASSGPSVRPASGARAGPDVRQAVDDVAHHGVPGARPRVDPGGRGVDRSRGRRAGGGGPERGERGVQRREQHTGRSAAALDRHPLVAGPVHGHDGQRRRRRAVDGQRARDRPDPGERAGPGAGPRVAHHRAVGEPDGVHVADAVVPAQRRHQRVEEADVVDPTVAGRPAARPRVPGAVEPVRVGDHQALAVGERVPAQVRAHVGGRAPGAVQHHHERGAGGRRRPAVHGRRPVSVGGAQGDRARTRRGRHDGGRAAREAEERHDQQEHRRSPPRRGGPTGRGRAHVAMVARRAPSCPEGEPGWVIEEVISSGRTVGAPT